MTYAYDPATGSLTVGATAHSQAVRAVESALRARRNAHAVYGRAVLEWRLMNETEDERSARQARLRERVIEAQAALDAALAALEELL